MGNLYFDQINWIGTRQGLVLTHYFYDGRYIQTKIIRTKKLGWVFDNYLGDRKIDFLTVDVEGFDLNVLMSNDWYKYRPKVIVIENFVGNTEKTREQNIARYLNEKGYLFYCNSPTNHFYIEKEYLKNKLKK